MLRVGLSGGIGSGKSTVAQRFRELGALVVDSDVLAREVVAPGSEGLAAVAERFGPAVVAADGSLDRPALGARVFADAQARRDLEQITHPRIAARTAELVAQAPDGQIVVHDVPLLVEKQMGAGYHLVVIVGADERTRIARLTRARGLTEKDARARIAAQASDAERRAAADVWLDNTASVDDVRDRVDALWHERLVPFNDNLLTRTLSREPNTTTLVPYDDSWPAQAARLTARVQLVLREWAESVEHIGATSVHGLIAQDVIDLLVAVRSLDDADDPAFLTALSDKGFPRSEVNVREDPKPDRPDPVPWAERLHGSADPGRVAQVHLHETGSPGWRRTLLFRDWLRAEPGERDGYAARRRQLAGQGGTTEEHAVSAAPRFTDLRFTDLVSRAEAWARHTGWSPR